MITIRGWRDPRPDLGILAGDLVGPLRCADWKIAIGYAPDLCDASGAPVYGLCSRLVDNKSATIVIRDPSTPVEGAEVKLPGRIVLHELGHLVIAGLGSNSPEAVAREEQAVWGFTDALADALDASGGVLGDQEILTARAMVARVQMRGAAAGMETKMNKWAKLAAALAAADEEKDPEKQAQMRKAAMAEASEEDKAEPPPAKDDDKPPQSEKGEGQAQRAARALTAADVSRISADATSRAMREHTAREELLAAAAPRMTPGQRDLWRTLPLDQVRAQIAALPTAPPAAEEQRRAGIQAEPLHQGAGGNQVLAAHLETVDRHMGIRRPATPQAIEIDPNTGDLRLSHQRAVKLVPAAAPPKGA